VFKIKPEPPLDIIKIVMASRLIRDKGVYEFVKAAEIVKSSRNKTEFLLYGSPSPNNPTSLSLEEIEHINKDGKVKILGHTNNVMNAYSEAHIVCLPSYREGLPKSLIEASACGRAIITTDVPGCRDAIIPNVTGLLVAPKDALDLSKKILELVDNHSLRRILGINGRKVAEDKFDIKKVVETHSNIYRQLLEYKEKHFEKSLRD
jgi:glycosyltransferase involved in cell wall biosynthesis